MARKSVKVPEKRISNLP